MQNGRFSSKIVLRLKKFCYIVLCVKTVGGKVGLTIRAKMIGWGRPRVPEILDQTDRIGAKSPIFDLFSLLATQP